jgi:hypothetical protein
MVAEILSCIWSVIPNILHGLCEGLQYNGHCHGDDCCCDCCCGLFTKKKLTVYEIKSKEPIGPNYIIYQKNKDTSNYAVNTDIITNNIEHEATVTPMQYDNSINKINDIFYPNDIIL